MLDTTDTIVALASARQGGTRGVIRLSGPRAVEAGGQLVGGPLAIVGRSPQVLDVEIRLGETGARRLPATLLVWPGQRSYTCQPTVEIHTIGSLPLLEMIVRQATHHGCRLARPGEFTLRAFLAGRIDLTEAEAVLGVIDATSTAQFEVALNQLAGGMSRPLVALREELLIVIAELEAGLDFAEEDVEFLSDHEAARRIGDVAHQLESLCNQLRHRGHASELPRVVLAGPANAGKSSLFNALVRAYGAERMPSATAIVSPIAGATRDYLTARLVIAGVEFELVDTAGEFERDESEGATLLDTPAASARQMAEEAREQGALILQCSPRSDFERVDRAEVVLVATRCDEWLGAQAVEGAIATSVRTGQGLEELARTIADRLEKHLAAGSMVPATAARCDESLRLAVESVRHAHELAQAGHFHELVVHELRHALDQLGQVAGVVATDDILDRVFKQFCIGK